MEKKAASVSKKYFGLVSSVAVAATIVMAVLLVSKPLDSGVESNREVLVAANTKVNDYQGLSTDSTPVSSVDRVQVVQRSFSPEHARMLNQYLLRHAENSVSGGRSGLMPLARVASFSIAAN
jgi:hypothetical protein